jgi:putative transposase
VESETYLLACHRYIELNPVRAGMVAQPGDYQWSSYRHNAEGQRSSLVIPHSEYLALGNSVAERRAAYRAMFAEYVDSRELTEIRDATNGEFVLGGKPFHARISQAFGRRVARANAGRPRKITDAHAGQRPLLE